MIYHIAHFCVKTFLHIRFRVSIKGIENIPDGGCILAMNHTSNWDPLIVGTHTPRKMHIMAKEELFKVKFFANILNKLGAFPVKRDQADLKSLRSTLKIIQEGKLFSIFIEGTRSKTGEMQAPKKGIGFIVSKSNAPVIPTYIFGVKQGWFKQAGVIFGKPIHFEEGLDYEEIALTIQNAIKELQGELS